MSIKQRTLIMTSLFFIAAVFLALIYQREIIGHFISSAFSFSAENVVSWLAGHELLTVLLGQMMLALKETIFFIVAEILIALAIPTFLLVLIFRIRAKEGWSKPLVFLASGYGLFLTAFLGFMIFFGVESFQTYQGIQSNIDSLKKAEVAQKSAEIEEIVPKILEDPQAAIQKIKSIAKHLEDRTSIFTMLSEWMDQMLTARDLLIGGAVIAFISILIGHILQLYTQWKAAP
ncbi:hypothetical protein [Listeria costaricensis]|uniref:hypothetical protein n=1 Tax=Listeria costaricensis TaxID=2026604 RepID=UPI000C08C960|nr:hypothetical protein [Listeria costaricensis]